MEREPIILSIITPLYNCQNYIRRCLKSIYNLDLAENRYEVIVVDDGSTDDSCTICREFEREHSNFHLLVQKNEGASSARNAGLDIAEGNWIWFVDADDRINDTINELIPILVSCHNVDMVCFNYQIEEEESVRCIQNFKTSYNCSGVEYLDQRHRLYLWDKIIWHSVIRDIRFLHGTKNIEDMLFCLETIVDMTNILCFSIYGYIYNNINLSSTSRRRDKRNLIKLDQDSIRVHSTLKDFIETKDGKKASVLLDIERFSIVGHLYSLMSIYSVKRLRSAIDKYRRLELYPLKMTKNWKANLFVRLANCEILLLLLKKTIDKCRRMR